MVSILPETQAQQPEHATPPLAPPDFVIVPRMGLALAAVIIAALVVAVSINGLWGLEFMHVAFGAAWTIIDLFIGLVIGPILRRLSSPARIEFITRFMPKMVVLMPAVVTATLVAGWQLSTKLGTNQTAYVNHGWIVASMIVVGVMSIIALGLLEPANVAVLIELKKKRPRPEVIEGLTKRFVYCSGVIGAMQIATLVIMTRLAS